VISERAGKRKHGFALECAVFLTVLHPLFVSGSDHAADRWREDYAIAGVFLYSLREATMSKKSSVPQAVSFISQVLKRDNRTCG
jgi:hypothetical protein